MAANAIDAHAPIPPAVERAGSGERRERRAARPKPLRRPLRAAGAADENESIDDDLPPPPRGRLDVVA